MATFGGVSRNSTTKSSFLFSPFPGLQQIYSTSSQKISGLLLDARWGGEGRREIGFLGLWLGKSSITQLAQGHGLSARGWDKEGKHGELPGRRGKVGGNDFTKEKQTREMRFCVHITHLVVIIHAS